MSIHPITQAEQTPFFTAWLDAVRLAPSIDYFQRLRDKRPDLHRVAESLNVLSGSERVYLLSLCQFYNDADTRRLCADSGHDMPTLVDIARLDEPQRRVITRLINTYEGW